MTNHLRFEISPASGIPVLVLLGLALSSTPGAVAGGHGEPTADSRQERLGERLGDFSEAFANADVEALEAMLAEHYSHTNDSAPPLDREAWLASMERRRAELESGKLVVESMDTSDIRLGVSGNTAVVTGLSEMRGRRGDSSFALKIRFTNVWEWDGEDWYRVAFHDTYEPL